MKKIRHKLFFAIDCTNIAGPVGLMNNIQAAAEEAALAEVVYAN